jgi:bifunctional DNA-binding transcriptional regulator/antitoxin component of YhaV-PrlF toxin-antitoxin module
MKTVTVSENCQVTIPEDQARSAGFQPGQELQIMAFQGRIVIAPELDITLYRGVFKGMDTTIPEEKDRY